MRRWGQWGVFLSLSLTFAGLGAWHGAGWNYIIYGLIQGLIIFYEMKTATIRNKVKNWIGNPLFATLSILRTYLLFAVFLTCSLFDLLFKLIKTGIPVIV